MLDEFTTQQFNTVLTYTQNTQENKVCFNKVNKIKLTHDSVNFLKLILVLNLCIFR